MRRALFIFFFLLFLVVGLAWCQKSKAPEQAQNSEEATFSIKVAEYKSKVARMDTKLIGLRNQFLLNLAARTYLAARKRYLEAMEYSYRAGDYLGAAERLLGLVEQPDIRRLEDFPSVRFYLADSLFRISAYNLASKYLDEIIWEEADPFWQQALVERFFIASARNEFDKMRALYATYLQKFPSGQDGSAIDYLMGKAYYLNGQRSDATRCFERIPDTQGYAATAKYFLGVMAAEEGKFNEATSYFKQSVEATKHAESVNRKDVYDLANMAIARISYEQERYLGALEYYFNVPADSPNYTRVLYEVSWVYYTRNGTLIEELRQIELSYQQLAWQLESLSADLETPALESLRENVKPTVEEATKMQADIEKLIGELHGSLSMLKQEGTNAHDNLVKMAPDSPYVLRTALLSSRILSQLGDYDKAEAQFERIEDDYSNLKRSLEVALTSGTQLPQQFSSWLKYESGLSEFQEMRRLKDEIQSLVDDTNKIEAEVNAEISTFSYEASPILEDAMKRSNEIRRQLAALSEEGSVLYAELGGLSGSSDYKRLKNSITEDRESVSRLQSELSDLEVQIKDKLEQEKWDLSKLFADVSSPLSVLNSELAMVSVELERAYAEAEREKLQSYVSLLENVVFEAALGQIDVTWQRAQAVNLEIQRILRAQEEEIRKYLLSAKGEQ